MFFSLTSIYSTHSLWKPNFIEYSFLDTDSHSAGEDIFFLV